MGTLTTNLELDKPTVGADTDQWGTLLNQSLDTLDRAVQFGALSKSVAGGVNVTLTADEAAKQIIILTGAITANIAVIVPNSPLRRYVIFNNTTGAFTVTIRRAVGTGVVVPQGVSRAVFNGGSEILFEDVQNALNATNATNATTAMNVSGGTASVTTLTTSGAATLNGTATFNGNAALNANVTLGNAGTDTTTVISQVSANGSVGSEGQVFVSQGPNLSPEWVDGVPSLPSQVASGTSVSFVDIPASTKRITLTLNAVSSNGSSLFQVQLGTAAGFTVSGYMNVASAGNAAGSYTTGFVANINGQAAASTTSGVLVFTKASGNTWVCSGVAGVDNTVSVGSISVGSVSLAQVITQIRLTTINGTDSFDAGTVGVFCE